MRGRSLPSKTCQRYIKESKPYYEEALDEFLKMLEGKEKPYTIKFTFVRDSRRLFDLINPLQTVQDLMVKYGYIDDDNYTEITPCFGESYVDKEGAGVYIEVL